MLKLVHLGAMQTFMDNVSCALSDVKLARTDKLVNLASSPISWIALNVYVIVDLDITLMLTNVPPVLKGALLVQMVVIV